MDDAPTTSQEHVPLPALSAPESQVVHVVEAIYEDGVIKPLIALDLPAGTPITLHIATRVTAVVAPREDPLAASREHAPTRAPLAALAPGVARSPIQLPNIGSWLKAGQL